VVARETAGFLKEYRVASLRQLPAKSGGSLRYNADHKAVIAGQPLSEFEKQSRANEIKLFGTVGDAVTSVVAVDKARLGSKRFLFPGRWKFFAIWSVFIFLCVWMLVSAAVRDALTFQLLIMNASLFCLLLIPGYLYVMSSAEVLVDDTGISRRLFGRICQHIRWNDVKCIRESRVTNPRVSATVIHIISNSHQFWNFDAATTMIISERLDGFEKLVDILNERVVVSAIPVEVQLNSIWERRSKLGYEL
jgi:hypothetical protein